MNKKNRHHGSLPEFIAVDKKPSNSRYLLVPILTTLLGYILTALAITFFLPRTVDTLNIPQAKQKLQDLMLINERYDVLFLGTSHVFRGINPVIIKAEAQKLGCNLNTYNFGIPGLSILEQIQMLDLIDSLNLDIQSIYIEPYSVIGRSYEQFISDRRRFFYTWEHLSDLFLDLFTMPLHIARTAISSVYLSFAFLREQTGAGRLSYALFSTNTPPIEKLEKPIIRGFRALDNEIEPMFESRKHAFTKYIPKFRKNVTEIVSRPNESENSGDRFRLVMRVTDRVRAMGIQPGIILMPHLASSNHAKNLEKTFINAYQSPIKIINLNNPAKYNKLFNSSYWYDRAHLNKEGASALAVILASKLCKT